MNNISILKRFFDNIETNDTNASADLVIYKCKILYSIQKNTVFVGELKISQVQTYLFKIYLNLNIYTGFGQNTLFLLSVKLYL